MKKSSNQIHFLFYKWEGHNKTDCFKFHAKMNNKNIEEGVHKEAKTK